jgi:hypothetical protein
MLVPKRRGQQSGSAQSVDLLSEQVEGMAVKNERGARQIDGGEKLDRAFGSMGLR